MRTTSRRRNGDEAKQRAAEPAVRSHQAADRPANQRYYTVISRAVTEQGENTFSSREALYERARAAQMAALQKYHPSSLTKDDFDRERLALEQAIDQVEQENAITLSSSAHLGTNGSELRLAAKAQKLGAVAANRGQLSRSKSLLSFLSKIERGILLMFVLAVLALSPLIFIRGVWITDTAVSYLAWPINKITKTEYPPALATYQVVYSDGVAQEIRLFPEEIERVSNMAGAPKHHQIVRVIDPQGRIVWRQ